MDTSWRACPKCGVRNYWVAVETGYKWLPNSPCLTECPEKGCHWESRGDRLGDHWCPSNSFCDTGPHRGWDVDYG
jgi:hypothetical protein